MGNNKGNSRYLKGNDLSFKGLYFNYRQDHEIFPMFTYLVSIIISIGSVIAFSLLNLDSYSIKFLLNNTISISATLLGVILASFGLFAAITDKDFLILIKRLGQLKNVLFPFWFCSLLWSILLIYSLIANIFESILINDTFLKYNLFFILFLFCLSIGYTLSLIGDILKLTVYKATFENISDKTIDYQKYIKDIKVNNNLLKYSIFLAVIGFILINFDLFIYIKFKDNQIINLITGAINLAYVYIYFKFVNYLKKNNQYKILVKSKGCIKFNLLYISLAIVFFL